MSSATPHSIVGAVLRVVAESGLERATVRQVAAEAGVAIGTVQHHFPTKDDMIVAAFTEVVARIRARVAAVPLGADVRANLLAVLSELLPLDAARTTETRVQLAFATRAANAPRLAALQAEVLDDVRASIAEAFAVAWPDSPVARRRRAAAGALALVDGLALHAASSGRPVDAAEVEAALALVIDGLFGR